MKVPILFIIFNRLNTTKAVFSSIKKYQPEQLFIAADGARNDHSGEKENCQSVKDWVITNIDWDCEVKTLFQNENLGCGRGPASAISWFFDQVEEGIILEDDCVAHTDFFIFCEQMLEYYRDNNRISIISGCNFDVNKHFTEKESYFYSVFPYTWGWATWKRNWKGYDYSIAEWKELKQKDILSFIFENKQYTQAWAKIFNKLKESEVKDIWDYQFFFQCFKRKQLSIVPSVNLISNIGTGEMATHTVRDNPKMNIMVEAITWPLKHPKELVRNFNYDVFLQELNYGVVEQVSLMKKIKRQIKKQIRIHTK